MAKWIAFFAACAGCAAPYVAVQAKSTHAGLVVDYCGATKYRVESFEVPSGVTDNPDPSEDITFCMTISNGSKQPVRVDRSHVEFAHGKRRDAFLSDRDDDVFIVHPGQSRKFRATFRPLLISGEDAQLVFEQVFYVQERALKLAPLVVRKR